MSNNRDILSKYDNYKCVHRVNYVGGLFDVSEGTEIIVLTEYLNIFLRLYARIMRYEAFCFIGAYDKEYPKEHFWIKESSLHRFFKISHRAERNNDDRWYVRAWKWVVGG